MSHLLYIIYIYCYNVRQFTFDLSRLFRVAVNFYRLSIYNRQQLKHSSIKKATAITANGVFTLSAQRVAGLSAVSEFSKYKYNLSVIGYQLIVILFIVYCPQRSNSTEQFRR